MDATPSLKSCRACDEAPCGVDLRPLQKSGTRVGPKKWDKSKPGHGDSFRDAQFLNNPISMVEPLSTDLVAGENHLLHPGSIHVAMGISWMEWEFQANCSQIYDSCYNGQSTNLTILTCYNGVFGHLRSSGLLLLRNRHDPCASHVPRRKQCAISRVLANQKLAQVVSSATGYPNHLSLGDPIYPAYPVSLNVSQLEKPTRAPCHGPLHVLVDALGEWVGVIHLATFGHCPKSLQNRTTDQLIYQWITREIAGYHGFCQI